MNKTLDARLVIKLEEIALEIRNILQIPENEIINTNYLENLIKKINDNFPAIKIKKGFNMELNLKDGKMFTIEYPYYSYPPNKKGENFDYVIQAFSYSILLNKKELNSDQLEDYIIPNELIIYDKYTLCLSRAIMMPSNLFFQELWKHSTNENYADIITMEKKLNNSHVLARGRDLGLWDRKRD